MALQVETSIILVLRNFANVDIFSNGERFICVSGDTVRDSDSILCPGYYAVHAWIEPVSSRGSSGTVLQTIEPVNVTESGAIIANVKDPAMTLETKGIRTEPILIEYKGDTAAIDSAALLRVSVVGLGT